MTVTIPEPTVAPVVTEADVLRRAADLLEEFGHCKEYLGNKERGEFCALGATLEAGRDLGASANDAIGVLAASLPFGTRPNCRDIRCIPCWNDAPGRTKAEVVQRLREAAQRAA